MTIARTLELASSLLVLLLASAAGTESIRAESHPAESPQAESAGPAYNADGTLVIPKNYREWIFLSAGLDMSYSESATKADHSMFDNVFVDPTAWSSFKQTGHWPDKAVFVMENRAATSKGSINKKGHYQTDDLMGLEFHVRDESHFKGGWGFFAATSENAATLLPPSAECYACHQAHGAVDTTFTQFYPTAKPIAEKAGTFRKD